MSIGYQLLNCHSDCHSNEFSFSEASHYFCPDLYRSTRLFKVESNEAEVQQENEHAIGVGIKDFTKAMSRRKVKRTAEKSRT